MTSTVSPSTTDLAEARRHHEQVWHESSRMLREGRIEEFLTYWTPDGRYSVAYPVPGLPATLQGHEQLGGAFAGFLAATTRVAMQDVEFHQTDDPDVAFVQERMVIDVADGSGYENLLAMRVTFRGGLLHEIFEYYGENAYADLIRRIAALG